MFGVQMRKLSTLLCLTSAFALSAPAQAGWEYNALIGLNLGYVDSSMDIDSSVFEATNEYRENLNKYNDSGFLWGFLVGYQARCNGWLFGLEANVDWHDLEETRLYNNNNALDQTVQNSFQFDRGTVIGLTARAGYEINEYIMPYIRLGAETSDDDIRYTTTTNTTGPVVATLQGSERSYRFLGGVGVEMPVPVMSGLSARLEYNYHGKGKPVNATGLASDGVTAVSVGGKPDAHSGRLSIVYNFI